MTTDIQVDENENLFKTHTFRLERLDTIIWIDVFEHLNSPDHPQFFASPVDKPLNFSAPKDEFRCQGSTLEEALNSCLRKISGLARADLFEKKSQKS